MMSSHTGYHRAQVVERVDWTDELFSLRVSHTPLDFVAGQFTKLGLETADGELISRAYSLVNAPDTQNGHEFLITTVPQGKLSPSLQALVAGDSIWVGDSAHGDLTRASVPEQTQDLWLLATGTGIGPFLSLLQGRQLAPRRIILVHGVRFARDLAYQALIHKLLNEYQGQLSYHPVVSREPVENTLQGRIPALIDSAALQDAAGVRMSPQHSFAMLCGNPDMIKDTIKSLQNQGLERYRQATGGNIIHERYW